MKQYVRFSSVLFFFIVGLIACKGNKTSTPSEEISDPKLSFEGKVFLDQEDLVFTEDSIRNYVTLVNFFFTSCETVCPLSNRNMADILNSYANNKKVRAVSFTVDPANDSTSVLNTYAKHLNPLRLNWKFLTGEKQDIFDLARYQFKLITQIQHETGELIHSDKIIIVDQNLNIISAFSSTDQTSIAKVKRKVDDLIN